MGTKYKACPRCGNYQNEKLTVDNFKSRTSTLDTIIVQCTKCGQVGCMVMRTKYATGILRGRYVKDVIKTGDGCYQYMCEHRYEDLTTLGHVE